MKPSSFIPPVVALIIAGVWIGHQRQSIATLETASAVLRRHIAVARSPAAGSNSSPGKPAPPAKSAKGKEPLDWKKIGSQISEMEEDGDMGDMRTMIRLQQRLQAMTQDELVAALDEIAALDLPDSSRARLEQMLIGPLSQKDPEMVLSKFMDRLDAKGGMMAWTLSNAMHEWAKKDPVGAGAWFDEQIAAGKFDSKSLDGKSQSRNQFEGSLIGVLLVSDSGAAARRLGAMPEDQRSDVLSHYSFQQLKEENQLDFANLVRSQVPEKDQQRRLALQASGLVGNDGYEKVTTYLDRIQATPAERTACVAQAAESKIQSLSYQKKVTREDLDAMREWATAQSPGSADRITGKVLANASQSGDKMKFEEAAELAVQYHEASGNDDVLSSFLDGWPTRQNKDKARELAGKISDEKRRGEILGKLK